MLLIDYPHLKGKKVNIPSLKPRIMQKTMNGQPTEKDD